MPENAVVRFIAESVARLQSALWCDRCGIAGKTYATGFGNDQLGEECEELIECRGNGVPDSRIPCPGHYRTAEQLVVIEAARAEAKALDSRFPTPPIASEAERILEEARMPGFLPREIGPGAVSVHRRWYCPPFARTDVSPAGRFTDASFERLAGPGGLRRAPMTGSAR